MSDVSKTQEIVKSGLLVKARNSQSVLAQNILATLCILIKKELDIQRFNSSNRNPDDPKHLVDSRLLPTWMTYLKCR